MKTECHRIILPDGQDPEKDFSLCGPKLNHLMVLRAKVGDEVVAGVGGTDYFYKVTAITRTFIQLVFLRSVPNLCNPHANLTVYLPLIQLDKLSLCIQKLNELGARQARIVKFERSNVPSTAVYLEKLNKVALESCKQCNRSVPIETIKEQTLMPDGFDKVIFADEKETTLRLSDVKFQKGERVALIIGPEGGFSDRERNIIKRMKNVTAVSLGNRILRAETAVIAASAIILSGLGEM